MASEMLCFLCYSTDYTFRSTASAKTSSVEEWKPIAVAKRVRASTEEGQFETLQNGTLLVRSMTIEDEGLFKCQVMKNGLEGFSVTGVSVFKPPAKPEFIESYPTFTAGTHSEIGKCIAKDGYPVGNITWYKNGKVLLHNGNETQVKVRIMKNQNTGLYTIESTLYYTLSKNDMNAKFLCEVVYPSQEGSDTQSSEPMKIDVYYPIEHVRIEVDPSNHVIREGDTITLSCLADTNPSPAEYIWEKDGKQLGGLAQHMLPVVTKRDEGEYRCTVFDFDFNTKSAVMAIQVKAREDNNELDRFGVIAEESHSADHHGKPKPLNKAGMVIGIIVTLMLVAFFTIITYYMCYYRKKTEKKPLEDLEERNAMDPGNVSLTVEKVVTKEQ
ncbi:CD166 antigen-like [Carcharodon carcharias]|uniref:CD166 antigen-like n=1 Tax=Carcharodon carcharias TaxID=13397 RepID=UPI001B7DCEE3|nr:CD166 antigen-like [Carcharodon carcharias]